MQAFLIAMIFLWTVTEVELVSLPAGKCRHPIPSYPGLNFTKVEGQVFKYVYTPDTNVFKYVDSIVMVITQVQGNEYSEIFRANTIFGTTTKLNFNVEYLGDGILRMKNKKGGGITYMISVVALKNDGEIGLLYVCSDEGNLGEDVRFVFARKDVNPAEVAHPDILFKHINDKYHFKGMFRKLPFTKISSKQTHNKQHWMFK